MTTPNGSSGCAPLRLHAPSTLAELFTLYLAEMVLDRRPSTQYQRQVREEIIHTLLRLDAEQHQLSLFGAEA